MHLSLPETVTLLCPSWLRGLRMAVGAGMRGHTVPCPELAWWVGVAGRSQLDTKSRVPTAQPLSGGSTGPRAMPLRCACGDEAGLVEDTVTGNLGLSGKSSCPSLSDPSRNPQTGGQTLLSWAVQNRTLRPSPREWQWGGAGLHPASLCPLLRLISALGSSLTVTSSHDFASGRTWSSTST